VAPLIIHKRRSKKSDQRPTPALGAFSPTRLRAHGVLFPNCAVLPTQQNCPARVRFGDLECFAKWSPVLSICYTRVKTWRRWRLAKYAVFYSRPKIEPLGWDLQRWPEPEGTKHFDAITSDGRPVDFWFSGGWLTVSRGPVGAPVNCPEMEELLSVKIAPFGTMDIEVEQICDMLGITVNGCKIDSGGIPTRARGFDWSGRTTYWDSSHLMQYRNDAREFVEELCDAFPGSMLIQSEYGAHGRSRSRHITFLMASDEGASLGVEPKQEAVKKMLAAERGFEEGERAFAYSIGFFRDDYFTGDNTGARYIHKSGAAESRLEIRCCSPQAIQNLRDI
jgi:hypothetical protein